MRSQRADGIALRCKRLSVEAGKQATGGRTVPSVAGPPVDLRASPLAVHQSGRWPGNNSTPTDHNHSFQSHDRPVIKQARRSLRPSVHAVAEGRIGPTVN